MGDAMATNAILLTQARKIIAMDGIATGLRSLGATIGHSDMYHEVMVRASQLDDILVTMCTDLRRMCAEPYGDVQTGKIVPGKPAEGG